MNARSIDSVVADLLVRLEGEGVHGVRAWFAGKPHIVAIPDFDGGWLVVMTRGRITVKIMLDKDYSVTSIKVEHR
jgi:hypothetical protein